MSRDELSVKSITAIFLFSLLLNLAGCGSSQDPKAPESKSTPVEQYIETGDLAALKRHGNLRVLIPRFDEGDDHLPRAGLPVHIETDLLESFSTESGLTPVWIYVDKREDLVPYLLAGKGDVIAANFTITPERKEKIAFSVPITIVKEQIVTRIGDNIKSPADLVGRQVALHRSSSFWLTLQELQKKYPKIQLTIVAEDVPTEAIIDGVADGQYDVAVADSNLAKAIMTYRDDIKVAFDLTGERTIAWGVRPDSSQLLDELNRYLNKERLSTLQQPQYKEDLPGIKKHKVLRVLTRNNAATYFLWRGELMGFEYELARHFAKQQGLRIEMVVPPSREDLITWLEEGKGDVIAASLTINEQRKQQGIAFSSAYNSVSEVLVTRASEPGLEKVEDLAGRTVVVRRSSSYWDSLESLRKSGIDVKLQAAPEDMETEEIIQKVAEGSYDLTVADSNILDIELTWRDDIRAAFPLGDPVDYGWAVRAEDKQLLGAINSYFKKEYRGLFYNITYQKYFKNPREIRTHVQQRVDGVEAGALSPYDDLVRKYADKYNFDWRLVTSQMYQESRFDPDAKSWAGALGLLQVLPRTAKEFGYQKLREPEQGLQAGLHYLDWLKDRFEDDLSVQDRMWFALASYNAGVGHVRDARRLAKKMGWDSNHWFNNVERAMLLLSKRKYAKQSRHGYVRGREPVKYVREIRDRYRAYVRLTKDMELRAGGKGER